MTPSRPVRNRLAVGLLALGVLAMGGAGCSAGSNRAAPPDGPGPVTSAARPEPTAPRPVAEPAGTDEAALTYSDGDDVADDVGVDANFAMAPPGAEAPPHPLDGWTDEQIGAALRDAPERLGSVSFGSPNAGRLWGGVPMPEGDSWVLVDPAHAYGTQETVAALIACLEAVRAEFPDTPPVRIGHLSAREGGRLSPHLSHQSGRDADVGYYYLGDQRWYARATANNLDRARTWAFVRALVTLSDVEMILIDAGLQPLLRQHALAIGEDPAWVESVFRGGRGLPPLVRHARGHATHLHVRFFSPIARETARRAHAALAAAGIVDPPMAYVIHRARDGDTLAKLAKRYGTSVQAIQRANGLRSTVIFARRTYRIPQPHAPAPAPRAIVVPPRRLPPPRAATGRDDDASTTTAPATSDRDAPATR